MTHRALHLYMILALSLVAAGILTQPFAHSKLYGSPEVSYRAYELGLGGGIVGWLAVSRWQEFRIWASAPIWVGALFATVGSVLLSRAMTNDEGAASGLMGLVPIFCWGALMGNRQEGQEVQLGGLSESLTVAILCAWGTASTKTISFPTTIVGLTFLTITFWRSPLRQSIVNLNFLFVGLTALVVAISPYRQWQFLRWIGFDELPWKYLRESIIASLNPSGIHVVLPYANDEFLQTSLIEWQGYLPGLIVGATAVGLPAWAIYEFARMKGGGWQRIFGLGLAACLIPFACLSLLSNLGLALTHLHGLPFFAPDMVFLIYGGLLVGALFATRSVSCHQPQLD